MTRGPIDPRDQRLRELLDWLHGLGCCASCSLWCALNTVAREHGEAPLAGARIGCGAPPHRRGMCDETARRAWKQRPQRAADHQPRKAA